WFYLDAQNNSHFCSKVHTVEQWDCYANTHPCTGYSLKGQLERWDGVHWVTVNSVTIASHEGHGIFGNPPSAYVITPDTPTANGVTLRACATDPAALVVCGVPNATTGQGLLTY